MESVASVSFSNSIQTNCCLVIVLSPFTANAYLITEQSNHFITNFFVFRIYKWLQRNIQLLNFLFRKYLKRRYVTKNTQGRQKGLVILLHWGFRNHLAKFPQNSYFSNNCSVIWTQWCQILKDTTHSFSYWWMRVIDEIS